MTCDQIRELTDAILDDDEPHGEYEDGEAIGEILSEYGMEAAL